MKKILINSNAKLKSNRGFTLTEIMVTVAILSLIFSLVNTSVMSMERTAAEGNTQGGSDVNYTTVNDILVNHPNLDDLIDSRPSGDSGEWRGFNPGVVNGVATGGYDVAYMVDYQNRTAEAPNTDINYGAVGGVDVKEGYQIPELTGLQPDKEGEIWAYGILLDVITYVPLEVSLVKIPYDNTGTDAQTATNAQVAAKIASSIIGTGVRDAYSNYLSYSYTNPVSGGTSNPNLVTAVVACGDSRVTSSYSADNGYGITHVFDRNNMLSAINSDMFYARSKYCAWTVDNTVLNGSVETLDTYLEAFNRDFNSCFAYTGANS